MGAIIKAVSIEYNYSQEKEDYVGEVYSETIDYGFAFFDVYRSWILRFLSCGQIESVDTLNDIYGVDGKHWADLETGEIYSFEKFPEEDKKSRGIEYWEKFSKFVNDYPMLKNFWPFAVHSDCNGIIKYQEAENLIPYFEDFLSHIDYVPDPVWIPKLKRFTEGLIKCCQDVAQHKGKLFWE